MLQSSVGCKGSRVQWINEGPRVLWDARTADAKLPCIAPRILPSGCPRWPVRGNPCLPRRTMPRKTIRKRPAGCHAAPASALVFKGVHKKNGKLQVTGLNKEYLGLVATDEEAVWDPAPLRMGQRAGRARVARDQASN